MGQRKTPVVDSEKRRAPRESKGWISMAMSSRWFVVPILLLAGIVWFGFYATHTKEIAGSDDREYASIARNIVNGKGIVRNFIYPVDINFFNKLPVPEFMHPPGYPLVIAGFFEIFGISESAALLPSYISYFLLVILLFYFARRHLDNKTAAIAAVMFIFNREILDFSLVALSESVYTLILFLFLIMMIKAKSLKDIFISGILLGVSHLIRENIYPFLLPLFAYLYFYPDLTRWKKIIYFILGVLVPIIPNMVRSFLETGSPFFSYGKLVLMTYTDQYPWMDVYRHIQNPSFEIGQFIWKYLANLVSTSEGILSVSNPYLLALFFVEMFHRNSNAQWKKAKILTILLVISQMLFVPLITFNSRYFIPFLPMIILFGSEGFLKMSKQLVSGVTILWKKRILFLTIFLFLVFFIVPTTYTIFKPNKSPALGFKTPQFGLFVDQEESKSLNDFLNGELGKDQLVLTDLSEIIEWKSDRFYGWLPARIRSIYEIHKKIPVDAILLTNVRTLQQMGEEWQYLLLSNESLPLYRNVKLYRGRRFFAKLLIRDGRE
jgi:4-amino-4-deoxy-L-arabinose transferase-like glycosyltransferase